MKCVTESKDVRSARPSRASASTAFRRASVTLVARRGSQAVLLQASADRPRLPLTATTLRDFIEKLGTGRFQIVSFLLVGGVSFSEGATMIFGASITHALREEWGLNQMQTGGLASLSFLGLSFGSYFSGFISDLQGRRSAILVSYTGLTVFGALQLLATGFTSLAILRFMVGFSAGLGVPAVFSMVTEVTTDSWRPLLCAGLMIMFMLGELFGCVGLCVWMPNLLDLQRWRAVCLWVTVPPLVFLPLMVCFLRESAHWLVLSGRVEEARLVLIRMAHANGHPEAVVHLGTAPEPRLARGIGQSAATPNADEPGEMSLLRVLTALLGRSNMFLKLVLFCFLCAIGNLVTFGLAYFWPVVFSTASEKGGQGHNDAAYELLMLRLSAMLPNIAVVWLVSWPFIGHRTMIFVNGPIGAFSVLAIWFCLVSAQAELVVLMGVAAITAGNLSFTVLTVFINESFPTQVRSSAVGIAFAIGRIGSVTAPIVVEQIGPGGFLAVCCLCFLLSSVCVLPLEETKGSELNDFAEPPTSPQEAGADPAIIEALQRGDSVEDAPADMASVTAEAVEWPFFAGTLGARVDLLLLVVGLAIPPTACVTFYLSSFCSFGELLRDPTAFIVRLSAVGLSALVVLTCFWHPAAQTASMESTGRLVRSAFGTAGFSFCLAVLMPLAPFVESQALTLVLGTLVGACAAAPFAGVAEFAAAIGSVGMLWLWAGIILGAAMQPPCALLLGYGPLSDWISCLVYFSVPACLSVVAGCTAHMCSTSRLLTSRFRLLRASVPARMAPSAASPEGTAPFSASGGTGDTGGAPVESAGPSSAEVLSVESTTVFLEETPYGWLMVTLLGSAAFTSAAATCVLLCFLLASAKIYIVQGLLLYQAAGATVGCVGVLAIFGDGWVRPIPTKLWRTWLYVIVLVICGLLHASGLLALSWPLLDSDSESPNQAVVAWWCLFALHCFGAVVCATTDMMVSALSPRSARGCAVRRQLLLRLLGCCTGLVVAGALLTSGASSLRAFSPAAPGAASMVEVRQGYPDILGLCGHAFPTSTPKAVAGIPVMTNHQASGFQNRVTSWRGSAVRRQHLL